MAPAVIDGMQPAPLRCITWTGAHVPECPCAGMTLADDPPGFFLSQSGRADQAEAFLKFAATLSQFTVFHHAFT